MHSIGGVEDPFRPLGCREGSPSPQGFACCSSQKVPGPLKRGRLSRGAPIPRPNDDKPLAHPTQPPPPCDRHPGRRHGPGRTLVLCASFGSQVRKQQQRIHTQYREVRRRVRGRPPQPKPKTCLCWWRVGGGGVGGEACWRRVWGVAKAAHMGRGRGHRYGVCDGLVPSPMPRPHRSLPLHPPHPRLTTHLARSTPLLRTTPTMPRCGCLGRCSLPRMARAPHTTRPPPCARPHLMPLPPMHPTHSKPWR